MNDGDGAAAAPVAAEVTKVEAIPFTVGQSVLHPKHGLGRVKGTEERDVAGSRQLYVIVEFARLSLTVGIPETALPTSGLRRPMTPEDLQPALEMLSGTPAPAQRQWSRRASEHEIKLNSGEPEQLAEVLRDLSPRRGRGRDGVIFREALARLSEELAIADESDYESATAKIEALLPPEVVNTRER